MYDVGKDRTLGKSEKVKKLGRISSKPGLTQAKGMF
jgi:hypothetical protein